jgi:hypothetical protein
MTLNLPMVKRVVRRLTMRHTPEFHTLASREWVLCPSERARIPPAMHLPGAIEKVRALSPWRNWETERLLLAGGEIEHAASLARVVPQVELAGAYLYRGASKLQPGFGSEKLFGEDWGPTETLDEVHLMTSQSGSHFFGTLMLDDMPLALIPRPEDRCISMASKPYVHEAGYRALLDLPRPREVTRARIRRLVCYTDFAQNSFKRARYAQLRSRLRAALQTAPARQPVPGVYLRRGIAGEPRVLVNEPELEVALRAVGFDILDPEQLSAREIAERSLDAAVVVAVEGSHLSHAIFSAADQATFLVIQPPDRFALAYKEFTDRMDMRFALVVADPVEGGFAVALDEVHRLLEQLL